MPGWECDLYVYFGEEAEHEQSLAELELEGQTALVRDGMEFPIYLADAVAIVPRGSDFLHYDPRFRTNINKWVSEGSKLGFATKLDVRAGCAYGYEQRSFRVVGDAARPSGGAGYSSLNKQYKIDKVGAERSSEEAERRRSDQSKERKQEELRAVKSAAEKGSREMRGLEQKELSRIEKEKTTAEDVSKGKISRRGTYGHNPSSVEEESHMVEGTPVYVRDAHYSWVPATIESPEE